MLHRSQLLICCTQGAHGQKLCEENGNHTTWTLLSLTLNKTIHKVLTPPPQITPRTYLTLWWFHLYSTKGAQQDGGFKIGTVHNSDHFIWNGVKKEDVNPRVCALGNAHPEGKVIADLDNGRPFIVELNKSGYQGTIYSINSWAYDKVTLRLVANALLFSAAKDW